MRVAADFIAKNLPAKTVWLSNPTWVNHHGIFGAPGLATKSYAYFDQSKLALDYPAFVEAISAIPANDVVVLHGCCHNPTGADLNEAQWREVASIAAAKGWIPLVDFAYQGFGDDIDSDAAGARILAEAGLPLIVAQSFSKNLGLYQDRVGALHVVTDDATTTAQHGGAEHQRLAAGAVPPHQRQLAVVVSEADANEAFMRSSLVQLHGMHVQSLFPEFNCGALRGGQIPGGGHYSAVCFGKSFHETPSIKS